MRQRWCVAAVVALAAVLVAACSDDGGEGTAPAEEPWGRTFLSTDVSRDLVPGTQIRLELADGEVRVSAGCNHLFGTAAFEGDTLVVTDMGGTEMGCDAQRHAQDEWLTTFLGGQPTWTLDGTTLTLAGAADTIVLVDREVADPDRPLEGTEWVVESIVDGDTVSSVPGAPGVRATMTFADQEVSRHNGCNLFSGGAVVSGDTIDIGLLVQTYKACQGAAATVESAVQATLSGAVSYTIEADQLTLTAANGSGLVLRAAE